MSYSYTISKAEITSHVRPLSVVWHATIVVDGKSHEQGPVLLSEWHGADGDPSTSHNSPDASAALAACNPGDRAAILAAVKVDVDRAGRELVAALNVPKSDLLASFK